MSRPVFATFEQERDADKALSEVGMQVSLVNSVVVSDSQTGAMTLESLDLTPEERSACHAQLKRGGFLMIAQAANDEDAAVVLRALHAMPGERAPLIITEAPRPAHATATADEAPDAAPGAAAAEPEVIEEQRIPVIEEELRIDKREVVRGRARVQARMVDVPVLERVELIEEALSIDRRPAEHRLTEEEVAQAGLLRERIIEVTAMREEAVVSKEAFVREELVVSKQVERRVEQIEDSVRRTEVETERLEAEEALERRP